MKDNDYKKYLWSSVAIAIVVLMFFVICSIHLDNKKLNSDNPDPKEPFTPNEVKYDGFTYSFLKLETNKKNIVYSPLSIKYALKMLGEGANGTTLDEVNNLVGDLGVTKYQNIDKVLSLANSIFIRDSYKDFIKDSYRNILQSKYDAEVIYDKFKSVENVNNWISNKTFGILKNVLNDSIISDNLQALLINALAIDMEWLYQFDDMSTYSSKFVVDSKTLDVGMMHNSVKTDLFKYFIDDSVTALSMPLKDYNGTMLEFVAVMPNSNLDEFIKDDNFQDKLYNILNNLVSDSNIKYNVALPRFEFNYELNLKDDLKSLGINTAFDENVADFSNMSSSHLYVSDAIHKADIKVSEKGIKAAAVTIFTFSDNAMMPEEEVIKSFTFDKPFMFVIRDRNNGEVWFSGTVYEPLLWKDIKSEYE